MANQSYINGVSKYYPVDINGNVLEISTWEDAKNQGQKKQEEAQEQSRQQEQKPGWFSNLGNAWASPWDSLIPYQPTYDGNPGVMNNGMLTSGRQLPYTATNQYHKDMQTGLDTMKAGFENKDALEVVKGHDIMRRAPEAWIANATEHPRTQPEFLASWLWHSIPNFKFGGKEEKEAEFDDWFEKYLANTGGGTGGGYGEPKTGTPFPNIAGYTPDWAAIQKARDIKAPEYKEREYDKWDDIWAGLSNFSFDDIAKATNIMNSRTDAHKQDVQDVYNRNQDAQYGAARENLATQLALENLRQKQAMHAAELAIQRWQSMQPRALGGNKVYWRDSNGNIHWEQVDKEGEARTLGGNEAMAALTSMDAKKLKNLSPEQIVKMAKRQSLLLQDNKAQVPYMQGYILQANDLIKQYKGK